MWNWIENHYRKQILKTAFPPEWKSYIENNVPHFKRLNNTERSHLLELVQVFVAEKHWEGCGGLYINDEIRVTIAAQACLLILALPHDLYRGVDSILVYPSTIITPERQPGVFEQSGGLSPRPTPILGEAQMRGPVILVWDSVLQTARHPERGHNLVFHEFAHKLDMLDGRADGTPPLENKEQYQKWKEVCSTEFSRLRELINAGKRTFLDSYGAINEAEFFAVITEQFFDKPDAMKKHYPELYAVLHNFYRQNPATQESAPARNH